MEESSESKSCEDDYNYLMDCQTNQQLSKSDAIRCQLIQLNALQNTFNSEVFSQLKIRLMNELSNEIDRNDGKNTYFGPAMHLANLSSRDNGLNRWNSRLFGLSEEQLFNKLNIKKRNINQIKSHEKTFVLKTDFDKEDKDLDIIDFEMSDVCDEEPKVPKTNLFNRVGLILETNNSISSKTNSNSQTVSQMRSNLNQNCSPTRVSGIFRKTNGNKSPINRKAEFRKFSQNNSNQDVKEVLKKSFKSPLKPFDSESDNKVMSKKSNHFITGFEKKLVEDVKKGSINPNDAKKLYNNVRQQPFKNPLMIKSSNDEKSETVMSENDEILKNVDKHMIETIENEIISNLEPIEWSSIAGLETTKNKIREIAVLPLKRPDIFQGIRAPPKGILLFGPPGTGKTLIGKCIASQTNSTFFSITVSSLTSKWIGEGEKMIKAMFCVARARQPSVIFIDEIDSLLKTRSDSEHECSRRMKTEFLAQFEGVNTNKNEKLLIIGATNRPQELDDAARRRLSAKLYIPLPDKMARKQIIVNCLKGESNDLTDEQINDLSDRTDGYSGADMKDLCRESAMESFRESIFVDKISEINKSEIRGITYDDFIINLNTVKPSVSSDDLIQFEDWNRKFGTILVRS